MRRILGKPGARVGEKSPATNRDFARARQAPAVAFALMDSKPRHQSFRVAVHRSLHCYIARVEGLPGCISRGATPSEAVENARLAIRSYLALAPSFEAEAVMVELIITP